jgi:type I restriction enzyme R subunit
MLGLKFAYATNGEEVIEFDYFTGLERPRADYPTPDELWRRYRDGKGIQDPETADRLLTPSNHAIDKGEHY